MLHAGYWATSRVECDRSVVVAHLLRGALESADGIRANVGETLIDDSGEGVRLTGAGEAIVVVLTSVVDAKRHD